MAISRMNMERQMRNMGGLMALEEPRQGYFLGKIVKKIGKTVKKVVKSPLGKAALTGAMMFGVPGTTFGGLLGRARLGGPASGIFGNTGGIGALLGQGGKFSTLGDLFRVGGEAGAKFSVPRILGGALAGSAIAAPFFMGEEEVDEGTPFTMAQPMIEDVRSQARKYYNDPTNSALYFMPPKSAVRSSFYAADGGLASMRPGYRLGGGILQKAGQMMKAGVGKVKSLFDDADISVQIRDEDVATDAGLQAQAVGQDVFITPKSKKAVQVIDGLIDEGYDIAKAEDGSYTINAVDEGALDLIAQRLRIGSKGADEFIEGQDYMGGPLDEESKMIYDALRNRKADGGIMDLGGLEKDYREGGFVPLGEEERADDVPARLSKNEFVFTADAVRNAGDGDIDKGAEVMQNMMDNLESGGSISEESQGMENPAQEMFDQAQMLENRIE
tara:strand:+ start:246 stop:1574 length:1329 start_codon:yes stop_codon:yes gene_type:complete